MSWTRNLKSTAKSILRDLGDSLRSSRAKDLPALNDGEIEILRCLEVDGYCIVEGFWDRERALSLRTRLEEHVGDADIDFDSGAYLRVKSSDRPYDRGIARLYHVEKLLPELEPFRFDPLTMKIAHAYYRRPFHSGMLIYQYNPPSTEVTRTFHVDSFTKEFKAFLYLDDVDESNGPFTYVRGSHRAHSVRIRKQLFGNREDAPTTFFEADVASWMDREVKILGEAGTLVLADVRGLHRGSPQHGRSRSVLVNYILDEPTELHPER